MWTTYNFNVKRKRYLQCVCVCAVCTQSEREQIKIEKQTVVRAVIPIYVFFKQHIVIRGAKSQSTIQNLERFLSSLATAAEYEKDEE